MPTRQQFYALIHMGAARLGYADEADYRSWLHELIGKCSLKECNDAELTSIATTLRACGALENPRIAPVQGGKGTGERPTRARKRPTTASQHRPPAGSSAWNGVKAMACM